MSRVQEIEERVRSLSGPEVRELRDWLDEFEAQLWDEQLAADSKAGRLSKLVERALGDERDGKIADL